MNLFILLLIRKHDFKCFGFLPYGLESTSGLSFKVLDFGTPLRTTLFKLEEAYL